MPTPRSPSRSSPRATPKPKPKPKPRSSASTPGRSAARGERSGAGRGRSSGSSDEVYTKPRLRERLKDEITKGDEGGRPGQWSARKAQLLARRYEEAGGGYASARRSPAQKHLTTWTAEDWTTRDGKPAERGGQTARYLPRKAWSTLDEKQARATDQKKRRGSKEGKQFVPNTAPAKAAGKRARAGRAAGR